MLPGLPKSFKYPLNRFSLVLYQASSYQRSNSLNQVEYIISVVNDNPNTIDWSSIKSKILSQQGNINQKNYDGFVIKYMVNHSKFEAALSFANHLRNSADDMTLGSINGLLGLYYEISKTRELTKDEETFIMDAYKKLYAQYKALDFFTCEKLVRALCAINEWEKALWVLEDIHCTSKPSHTAFSVLIGTLFKNNKKKKALEIISESIKHKRPLQYEAFEQWINFILRKYKDRKSILKQIDLIHDHIARNYAIVDESTAKKLKETYTNLGWDAEFTKIIKKNGECVKCKETLDCLKLSDEDFTTLQNNVKEKLIVGSDLFLNTSPDELKRFLCFVEKTAPYDIVIDALNVAYAVGKGSVKDRITLLLETVQYFRDMNKRILLLGRRHMLKWGRGRIEKMMNSTCTFFTDDLSQDDPYFITAAILSGPHTDIVSKDLLRGHQFNLQDEDLRHMFKKWQWQHQWMIFLTNRGPQMKAPLVFTPCAQKSGNNGSWHLPYQSEAARVAGQVNDGTPDLSSWLCIRRNVNK